jgi:hypothetical protein
MGMWIKVWAQPSQAINHQPGSTNELRVRASERRLDGYINGKRVLEFMMQAPAEELRFGFHFELDQSPDSRGARDFRILRYRVGRTD